MDPFSFAASVGSLSSACIFTVKRLGELAVKLKDAPKIIQDVSSEARIITISLSLLHNILVSDEHTILAQALLTPDIRSALDVALTGCSVTLSCIENEIHSLTAKIDAEEKLNFADRAKVVLKDNKFNELLQQLRRQHNAIAILQQGLQMKALADIIPPLKSNRLVIQKVAEGTESLRGLYPEVNAAKSFLESFESPNRDEPTFSIVSERQFEFDDVVTSSQAYRRVLVAATHTLRTRHSGNVLANGDINDPGHNEASDLSTQGASQDRKISAAAPSRSPIPTSPNKVLQNGLNRRTTISDPINFVQQLRGYVDQVEGELMSATDETVQLREMMEEKDRLIQDLENRLQTSAAQFENIKWKLRQEMQDCKAMLGNQIDKVRAEHREQVNSLENVISTGKMELKDRIEKEMAAKEHLTAEMEAYGSRVLRLRARLDKTENNLQSTTKELHATQNEMHNAHEALIAEKRKLEAEMEKYNSFADYHQKTCQEFTAECKQLEQKSRNREESFQKGNATQFGSILLVPFQSPAWLDVQGKGPHIWEAIDAPETPEGWETQWNDQRKSWSFMNQHTKETQFKKPKSPAEKSPKLPETPDHTPTSSSVSSSAGPIAKLSSEKLNETQPSTAVPRTDSTTGPSSEGRRLTIPTIPTMPTMPTTASPTGPGPTSPVLSGKKKRKSKLPFT